MEERVGRLLYITSIILIAELLFGTLFITSTTAHIIKKRERINETTNAVNNNFDNNNRTKLFPISSQDIKSNIRMRVDEKTDNIYTDNNNTDSYSFSDPTTTTLSYVDDANNVILNLTAKEEGGISEIKKLEQQQEDRNIQNTSATSLKGDQNIIINGKLSENATNSSKYTNNVHTVMANNVRSNVNETSKLIISPVTEVNEIYNLTEMSNVTMTIVDNVSTTVIGMTYEDRDGLLLLHSNDSFIKNKDNAKDSESVPTITEIYTQSPLTTIQALRESVADSGTDSILSEIGYTSSTEASHILINPTQSVHNVNTIRMEKSDNFETTTVYPIKTVLNTTVTTNIDNVTRKNNTDIASITSTENQKHDDSSESTIFDGITELSTTTLPIVAEFTTTVSDALPTFSNEIENNGINRAENKSNTTINIMKTYKYTNFPIEEVTTLPTTTIEINKFNNKYVYSTENTIRKHSENMTAITEPILTTITSINKLSTTPNSLLTTIEIKDVYKPANVTTSDNGNEDNEVSVTHATSTLTTILPLREHATITNTEYIKAIHMDNSVTEAFGNLKDTQNAATNSEFENSEQQNIYSTEHNQNAIGSTKRVPEITLETNEIDVGNKTTILIDTTTRKQEQLQEDREITASNSLEVEKQKGENYDQQIENYTPLATTINTIDINFSTATTPSTELSSTGLLNNSIFASTTPIILSSTVTVLERNDSVSFTTELPGNETTSIKSFSSTTSTMTETTFRPTLMMITRKGSANNILTASSSGGTGNDDNNPGEKNEIDVNVIIAISVSVIGVIALLLLVAFFFLMRKRQKQISYGQRCRPVSLDAYSLDNISALGSVRRKGAPRNSKRSYSNAAFDDPSLHHNILTANELIRFVEKRTGIYEEFRSIPQIIARADDVQNGCEDKNRYANVVPLPETRVLLQRVNEDDATEYINANYVKGVNDTTNYYIACQAPLLITVTDFWRMIWEQHCHVIIQATGLIENGIEKCAEYLPPSATLDNHNTYGDFQITLKNREVRDRYAISTVLLKHTVLNKSRELSHYWYKWPETGVPIEEAPIIAMLLEARSSLKSYALEQISEQAKFLEENFEHINNRIESTSENTESNQINSEINGNNIVMEKLRSDKNQGPLIVHCSPGTGRTGTIIACDIALRCLETTKRSVDIPQIVYYVRRGRASAVQTKDQYEFIYKVASTYATKITNFSNDN